MQVYTTVRTIVVKSITTDSECQRALSNSIIGRMGGADCGDIPPCIVIAIDCDRSNPMVFAIGEACE